MRAIIKYKRTGAAAFISHLDMQRAMARALRRSRLPVRFSEGFNPHILTSFASPLSVGIETMGDYLEVQMTQDCTGNEIKERLNAVLPAEIEIEFAGMLAPECPKLMSVNYSAQYILQFPGNMEEAAEKFMKMDACIAADRKGRRTNLRPLVYELNVQGNNAKAKLANSSTAALNPIFLAGVLLFGENDDACAQEAENTLGSDILILRQECFCMINGIEMPFYMLGK